MTPGNVGIFIFDDVEVLDFAGPFEVFSRTRLVPGAESRRGNDSAPFHVFTVARSEEAITAIGGLRIHPQYSWRSAPPIDILVIPGGFGTRKLLRDELAIDWVRSAANQASLVTSVCTGALLLAQAGLLRGRHATTHWAACDLLAATDPTIVVERGVRVVHDTVITFVPFVRSGNLIFLAGHIAKKNGKPWSGQLGDAISTSQGNAAARDIAVEMIATLHAAAGNLNNIQRIVKLLVLVNSTPSFTEQHLVANGASQLLVDVFGKAGAHARSSFGVAQIPFGSCLEIELIAEVGDA